MMTMLERDQDARLPRTRTDTLRTSITSDVDQESTPLRTSYRPLSREADQESKLGSEGKHGRFCLGDDAGVVPSGNMHQVAHCYPTTAAFNADQVTQLRVADGQADRQAVYRSHT
jgi:hypothetical protein